LTPETLLVIAVAIGFYKAWNIGGNDVANGMGTVVGAGTLTLRQAIVLASMFEFLGAFFVGSHVTETIKGGIVPMDVFAADPLVLGVGMLAVALASAVWLNICTLMSRPVSVTQATVGGIIGFALVCPIGGISCVQWAHLAAIGSCWVASPLVGAVGAYLVYRGVVKYVLKSRHPVFMAKRTLPIGAAATLAIVFLATTYQGLPFISDHFTTTTTVLATAALALAVYLGTRGMIYYRTRGVHVRHRQRYEVVEQWFGRLQVVTACYMSFAHGANDVASAIGPLAASMQAFSGQALSAKTSVSPWLMAFGGAGIVIGLATMGYKVIATVGKKITEITPTRGFSAEFATASTVLICSKLGMPISNTLVMIGAIIGVGFARGFGALDLKVVRHILGSWLMTIPVSAMLAAVIFWAMRWITGI
jgi:PiT family inorganic phosphate transporter